MNIINFVKKNKTESNVVSDFPEFNTTDYQKAINRQGSKKLIQSSHLMHHQAIG
jgi:hypothetical protein